MEESGFIKLKKGGYSLIGKTANLHFVILGSIPNISTLNKTFKKGIGSRWFYLRIADLLDEVRFFLIPLLKKAKYAIIGVLKFGNQAPLRTE
jgi:hypothetical protein